MSAEKAGTLGTSWGEENLTWWEKRSKLEKKLIVALIVSSIILSAFLIFYTTKPHAANNSSVCSSSACLEAASLIVTHIDTTIDPCDDFFKFTCGKFIEHTHGDLKATSIKEIKAQVQRQVEEIMNEPINDDDHYSVKREKKFLLSCLNETAAEEEALEVFEEHLQELNGWPVVVGYKWRERYFDWLNMIIKLKRRGYPYEMLLSFTPTADPTNTSKVILMINTPFVSKTEEKHKELYKTLMTDIAVAFGADRNRAVLDMEKVLDFKEKLHEISVKNRDYTKPLEETRFTIEEYQEYNNEIDWLDFLNTLLYPAANITNEDYVIFPRNEFMEDFFSLIYTIPKRIQANYIIWSAIEPIAPLLPKKIQQIIGNYSCQTSRDNGMKALYDRKKFCNELFLQNYIPKPSDIIYARKYLPEEEREKVIGILTNVKNEFVTTLQENSWMDDESRENAVKKIESINEIIGAPGDYFNDTIFDVFEGLFPDDSDEEYGFFEQILFYINLQNDYLFATIENEMEANLLFYHMITWVNAGYLVSYNSLMVPAAILQGIMFDYERPMYLNYGTVGSIIGHELTHALAKDCENIKADEIWTEESAEAFKDAVNCMIESAENFDVEGTNHTINGTLTLEENIADFTGTKVSYRAYKQWVLKNGEEPQLPGIDYTPEQLFWIASILHECYKLSGEKLEQGLECDLHANNAFRATGPFSNNPDFAKDFNCPVGSNMNPSEKCQIF